MIEDIKAAQQGDHQAYGRLVRRFEPLAMRYARHWLGDPAMAEDVTQEAFIDAFLRLPQLREPKAFPGWFRRVVQKHCDRRTRRSAPPTIDVEPAVDAADMPSMFTAIETLPPHERIVVALHYLGDEPQADVADFLEVPLSTVKKRLHSARNRLRRRRTIMPEPTKANAVPLEDRITLFITIRNGDAPAAAAILDRHPELVDAEEQWSTEEALAGGFPLAHRLTPLVLAASRGDTKMVRVLLERGAAVDGTCGCDAGETPLLAAALSGHAEVVGRLLEAGADPQRTNRAGYTALDVSTMRHHDDVRRRLGDHATNVVEPETRWTGPAIETGIKAIDLLAPLEAGMLVRVHGAAETGLTVLLAEITHRIGALGGHAVWTCGSSGQWYGAELSQLAAELGVLRETTVVEGGALEVVRQRAAEHNLVALFVFLGDGGEAEVEAALTAFKREATITFVIDPWVLVTAGKKAAPTLAPPYGAVICTSPTLAQQNVYPAIDPHRTQSTTTVSEHHDAVRASVRTRYDAEPDAVGAVMNQPFVVYEHQTGRAGEVVPLRETLRQFETV